MVCLVMQGYMFNNVSRPPGVVFICVALCCAVTGLVLDFLLMISSFVSISEELGRVSDLPNYPPPSDFCDFPLQFSAAF